jgi:hypothetical protein
VTALLKKSGHGKLDHDIVELEAGFCEYAHGVAAEFFGAMRAELKRLCDETVANERDQDPQR